METRRLPVKLTQQEHRERSEELARQVNARELEDASRKEAAAVFKEALDEYDTRIKELARVVDLGQEDRFVPIEATWSTSTGLVTFTRMDTGEIVESRTMTADELADHRQLSLLEGPKGRRGKRGAAAEVDPT